MICTYEVRDHGKVSEMKTKMGGAAIRLGVAWKPVFSCLQTREIIWYV